MTPPQPLASIPQWLGYRKEWQPERGKYTKKPVSSHDGRPGSSTNPATWGSFEQAAAAVQRLDLDGVGFALTDNDPFTAIDLDGCRNPETGEIEPWAWAIVRRFGSYTEVSPSGIGLHIILAGALPVSGRRSEPIEVYHSGRYITVTGDVLPGFEEIHERGDELAGWFAETFPVAANNPAPTPAPRLSLTDEDILQKAGSAKNGAAFLKLYAGDTSTYGGDHSRADLGLMSMLAFWTQDEDQLDRLFRSSGLMRKKWANRADYRRWTIDRALSDLTETYNPARLSLDNNGRAEAAAKPSAAEASTGDAGGNEAVAALQAQITELQERLRIADAVAMRVVEYQVLVEERNQQLRECAERNKAMHKVLAHPTMNASMKVIGLAALTHLNAREDSPKYTDPELGTRIDMDVIARLSGMGTKTVGKAVTTLADAGLWERKVIDWDPPGGGPPISKVWLRADGNLTERTRALATVEIADTGHGGHREKKVCAVCGSDDVHRRSLKECHSCGHEWEKVTTPLNPPDTDSHDDAPNHFAAAGGQDDLQRYIETTGGQDDAPRTQTVDAPSLRRSPVVHFVPEPSDGIEELDIGQGAQPLPSGVICRHVFGQECYAPGCTHQPRYIPVGAG